MSVLMCVAHSSARTLYPGDREANYYCNSYVKIDSHFRQLLLPSLAALPRDLVCLSQQLFVFITDGSRLVKILHCAYLCIAASRMVGWFLGSSF